MPENVYGGMELKRGGVVVSPTKERSPGTLLGAYYGAFRRYLSSHRSGVRMCPNKKYVLSYAYNRTASGVMAESHAYRVAPR